MCAGCRAVTQRQLSRARLATASRTSQSGQGNSGCGASGRSRPDKSWTGPAKERPDRNPQRYAGRGFWPLPEESPPGIVRQNWYALIPADAKTKKGKLAIEFALSNDGHVRAMKLVATSGDQSLDRAAWGGIIRSDPFPPLPAAYKGNQLALRFRFFYNPDKSDLAAEGISTKLSDPIVPAALIKSTSDANPPQYPKKARKDKLEGIVRLKALIGPDGRVRSIESLEGNLALGRRRHEGGPQMAVSACPERWQAGGRPCAHQSRVPSRWRTSTGASNFARDRFRCNSSSIAALISV